MAFSKTLNKATLAPGTSILFSFESWHIETHTLISCLTHPSPSQKMQMACSTNFYQIPQPLLPQKEGIESSMLLWTHSSRTEQQSSPASTYSWSRGRRNPSGIEVYKGLYWYRGVRMQFETTETSLELHNLSFRWLSGKRCIKDKVPASHLHSLDKGKPSMALHGPIQKAKLL